MDTPSRVLRRVQQMEEVELPSLPSIQHDNENDSGMSTSDDDNSRENVYSDRDSVRNFKLFPY